MADYAQLRELLAKSNSPLRNRVGVAMRVAAQTIRSEDDLTENHANRLVWARDVTIGRITVADGMLDEVIIANKDATPEQISGASDATIQTAVDTAVDFFATGS